VFGKSILCACVSDDPLAVKPLLIETGVRHRTSRHGYLDFRPVAFCPPSQSTHPFSKSIEELDDGLAVEIFRGVNTIYIGTDLARNLNDGLSRLICHR